MSIFDIVRLISQYNAQYLSPEARSLATCLPLCN